MESSEMMEKLATKEVAIEDLLEKYAEDYNSVESEW